MYVDGEHARHQGAALEAPRCRAGAPRGQPTRQDRRPRALEEDVSMLAEVATMQMAAVGGPPTRGSLDEYCLDGHAEAYSQLSQGLAARPHVRELSIRFVRGHVALRTVRTIDAIERISPLQRVAWKYDPDAPARRTEEAVKAQEERRLREAMEEMMAPSEKAAAKAAAPAAARRAAGGRAGRRASRSRRRGDVGGDARAREGARPGGGRPEEDGSRRQAGPRPRPSRVDDVERARSLRPLPTSCRGRRTRRRATRPCTCKIYF